MARTNDDKPAWVTEAIKAVVLAGLVWGLTNWLSASSSNEHRFTALETGQQQVKEDIKEMKQDVKEILKALK